uniref:F-box domain-containing protein n=1 Tax=Mycena chlorophos TaxID=658473 RepID=A0ABQ0LWD3_MYCCL|nr:predicted protein [Mycena chlorophos]
MTVASSLRSSIALADADIASLEAQLAQRRADKAKLEAKLAAVVYPILSIPAELTTEIMLLATAVSKNRFPLVAARVCAQWRTIALSTPRLWTHVRQQLSDKTFVDQLGSFERWSERSGGLPLDISLNLMVSTKYLLPAITSASCVSRWRHVNLSAKFSSCCDSVLSSDLGPSLALHSDIGLKLPPSNLQFRSISLCSTTQPLHPTVLQSFSHLTTARLASLPSDMFLSILNNLKTIEVLTIEGPRIRHPDPAVVPTVLPKVHTLHFLGTDHLRYLTLPSLVHLNFGHYELPSFIELNAFLLRSNCSLQRVEVGDCLADTFFDAARAFRGVPEFCGTISGIEDDSDRSDLSGSDDDEDDALFANFCRLTEDISAGRLLPDVVSLELKIPHMQNVVSMFCSAVQDRIQSPSSKLKSLTLELPKKSRLPLEFERQLEEAGVQLKVY